jgi:GNAT superfamily N-acetyltransferase
MPEYAIEVEAIPIVPHHTQLTVDLYLGTKKVGWSEVFITDLSHLLNLNIDTFEVDKLYDNYQARFTELDIVQGTPYLSGFISAFALRPEARGQGHGQVFMKMLLDYLKPRKLKELMLHPFPLRYHDPIDIILPFVDSKENYCSSIAVFYRQFGFKRMNILGEPCCFMTLQTQTKEPSYDENEPT